MFFCFSVIIFFISIGCLGQNIPIDSIRFELKDDNRIYTYCKINESDSLLFLIDTGASDLVIDSEKLDKVSLNFEGTIENLGTTGTNAVLLSTNNELSWGSQVISNIPIISIPYPNEIWDGVLGLSVLTNYTIKIDYDSMKVYLFDKSTFKMSPDTNNKLFFQYNVPFIEIEVVTPDWVNRKMKVEIDTGSDRILDISTKYARANNLKIEKNDVFAVSTVVSSDGNSGKISNVFFPKVKISEMEFYQIPGGISEIEYGIMNKEGVDGILGNWFLKRFNLTFDFQNNYLTLEPNNHLHSPYYKFLIEAK